MGQELLQVDTGTTRRTSPPAHGPGVMRRSGAGIALGLRELDTALPFSRHDDASSTAAMPYYAKHIARSLAPRRALRQCPLSSVAEHRDAVDSSAYAQFGRAVPSALGSFSRPPYRPPGMPRPNATYIHQRYHYCHAWHDGSLARQASDRLFSA